MSNRTTIQQQTSTVRHNGETSKEVVVFDNYGSGTINLDTYSDNFYDDDLELLATVIQVVDEGGLGNVRGILDHVQENETGMFIEGTWYDWKDIKHVFEKPET